MTPTSRRDRAAGVLAVRGADDLARFPVIQPVEVGELVGLPVIKPFEIGELVELGKPAVR